MKLEITDDQTIAEVQGLFHDNFPFLKVDFFEKDPHIYASSKLYKPIANTSRLLGDFRPLNSDTGMLLVSKDSKVNEFEANINATYSLLAQVFRRSGNVWLETTVTNNWTLEEQNKQGEIITAQMQDSRA